VRCGSSRGSTALKLGFTGHHHSASQLTLMHLCNYTATLQRANTQQHNCRAQAHGCLGTFWLTCMPQQSSMLCCKTSIAVACSPYKPAWFKGCIIHCRVSRCRLLSSKHGSEGAITAVQQCASLLLKGASCSNTQYQPLRTGAAAAAASIRQQQYLN
jgi:hypothetical protein